jgi:hypothetical protein
MTNFETLSIVFGTILAATWPYSLRDFHRLYREAAIQGTEDRTKRTFAGIAGGGVVLSAYLLGSGLIHGNTAAIIIGCLFLIINGAAGVMISRYKLS